LTRLWARAWPPSRIGLRLLAFNLLVMFVPIAGVLYLDVYETQLLQAREREMVQQGRMLAASTAITGALNAGELSRVLVRLGRQSDARFRVYDVNGELIVDSAAIAPAQASTTPAATYARSAFDSGASVRTRFLYRLGAWLVSVRQRAGNMMRALLRPQDPPSETARETDLTPELRAALGGRYGAVTRETPGQRSLTLFSAVPIRAGDSVVGAVVVSQSTFRVLRAIYDVRLRIFEVVVGSMLAAAMLTTIAAMTIVRPLRRLRRQATALIDRRGPLPASFPGSSRKDELGDLARALEDLSHRVNEHIGLLEGFAADVAHEFKNPLASIRTAAEMIGQSELPADRDRFLAMMLRDVDRLERMVSGAREIARIDGAIQSEAADRLSIAAVVRDAVETTLVVHPGCSIDLHAGDERLVVSASRQRLAQVFENLLSNAVSFTPAGTAIDVTISGSATECTVAVADRGPGVPEAHMERIFERFFSYRPTSTRADHVGLGLAIAGRIVQGYGGTIRVSNRDGGGSIFEVRLPARVARANESREYSSRVAVSRS
jgi:two-component system sensor histidine kinase ChvG